MKKMKDELDDSKNEFENTKRRTLFQIDGVDEFLSNSDTRDASKRRAISKFKMYTENCSTQYNTTLLIMTKNSRNLDDAAIAPHRIEARISLEKPFSEEDAEKKLFYKRELKSFDEDEKKGEKLWEEFSKKDVVQKVSDTYDKVVIEPMFNTMMDVLEAIGEAEEKFNKFDKAVNDAVEDGWKKFKKFFS